ncbi:DUF2283 domain-containing protein [Candidatus Pacearchaeota archaeon]|nr:DUF2283 domain-containing protein [Candidatus Pacearchaeota archaeon]
MKGKTTIYYDEKGDFLEIFIEGSSPTYGEEAGEDITLFRRKDDNKIVGIGILNFKKRTTSLNSIKLNLPFNVNFSELKV